MPCASLKLHSSSSYTELAHLTRAGPRSNYHSVQWVAYHSAAIVLGIGDLKALS